MKLTVWANLPSPLQADLFRAWRQRGIDVCALYLGGLSAARLNLGWSDPMQLSAGEVYLPPRRCPFECVPDWQERLHVIPGYSQRVHRAAVVRLSRARVPWVHWSESSRPGWRRVASLPIKRWYAGYVNRSALGAFAIGAMAARDFRRWGIRREKIAYLFYAVDGVRATTTPDPVTREFVGSKTAFVFVGDLCRRKACDVLLKAFAGTCTAKDNSVLVIVGDGAEGGRLRRMARELDIADRVLFRGVVPRSGVGSVLVCCDALVLPSRFDGWGAVINEGASAGLALIASDGVGSARHLIKPEWNGQIVKTGDVDALARAICALARDPSRTALQGRRSRDRFRHFSPEANAPRFVAAVSRWLPNDRRWMNWAGYRNWCDATAARPRFDAAQWQRGKEVCSESPHPHRELPAGF